MVKDFEEECMKQGGMPLYSRGALHICEIPLGEKGIPVEKIMKLRTAALKRSLVEPSEDFMTWVLDPNEERIIAEHKLKRFRTRPEDVEESLFVVLPVSREADRNITEDIINWLLDKKDEHLLSHVDFKDIELPFRSEVSISIGQRRADESKEILLDVLPTLGKFYRKAVERSMRRAQISSRTVVAE